MCEREKDTYVIVLSSVREDELTCNVMNTQCGSFLESYLKHKMVCTPSGDAINQLDNVNANR